MSMARLWRDRASGTRPVICSLLYGWFTEGFDSRDLREAKEIARRVAAFTRYTTRRRFLTDVSRGQQMPLDLCHPTAPHEKLKLPEWYVSGLMMDRALDAICRRVKKFDRKHDIPYLAGYSLDGKTIYIDRHMPASFKFKGRTINTDRFLVLHEEVEKTLDRSAWAALSACAPDCDACRRSSGARCWPRMARLRPVHAEICQTHRR